jgi:hypothetical protein
VSDVAAVLIGPERPRAGDLPADVVTVPSLGQVRDAAARVNAPLLWLLDSNALPLDGALDALLESGCDPAVSLPVDAGGAPLEPELGRFTESDVPGILDAIRVRRVPLRHTYVISMLVRIDVVRELEPPDQARYGSYAGSEWTARVFAGRPGMLIPASRVRVVSRAPGSLHHALRMARTGVWGRRETAVELRRSLLRGR